MTRRTMALAAGALALAAGCNRGLSGPAFRMKEPSSVAIFWAYASKHPGVLEPYAAVANTGQDELVLFDPVDDAVVAAPIVIRPLSIPLPALRPALAASARFTKPPPPPDSTETVPDRPDLLVVVGAGSTKLQLIRTWQGVADANGVVLQPDPGLDTSAPIDLGGEVLALIATPKVDSSVDTSATFGVVPDRVRVIAALTGGRLAVVEYEWSGDPTQSEVAPTSDIPQGANHVTLVSTTPTIRQDLGFDALSLAVDSSVIGSSNVAPPASPPLRNPNFLYAATLDPIPPSNTLGVAELDMSAGTPDVWPLRALNAHTPTRLVAAYTLWERVPGVPGAYDQIQTPATGSSLVAFEGVDSEANLVHRVYAYRDPFSCGPTTSELCGIAVLDPATGDVRADPWHAGQFLPPIAIPAIPVALVPGPPAWNPPTGGLGDEVDPATPPGPSLHRFMAIFTGGNARTTTGVLFIPSEDGRSYFADLARWEVPSDTFELSPIGSMAGVRGFQQSAADRPRIGFYYPKNVADADATNGLQPRNLLEPTIAAANYFKLTPGFTPDDIWIIAYQGYLPAFAGSRPATIADGTTDSSLPAGMLRVTLQTAAASQVVNVFDPALGVRVGDIVEIWTVGGTSPNARPLCPDTTQTTNGVLNTPIEGKIVEVTRPDLAHLGGSLVIQPGDCVPVLQVNSTACDSATHGPWTSLGSCWSTLPTLPGNGQLQVRIRAGGGGDPADPSLAGKDFVVVGTSTGYAGRATSVELTAPPETPAFQLSNADEALSCPPEIIPYPPSTTDPFTIPACDETCRRACERAAVARRARRHHLTSVYCYKANTTLDSQNTRNNCETLFPEFALPQSVPSGATVPPPPVGTFDGTPPSGPALAFSLGLQQPLATAQLLVVRDTEVIFDTVSGRKPVSRFGGGANNGPAVGPMGAVYFDRSWDATWGKQGDRYRFFVPNVGNLILDTTAASSNGDTRVLR